MADALVKHAFVSAIPEGTDATKIRTSNWNAALLFTGGNVGEMLTRDAGATGAAWTATSAVLAPLALSANAITVGSVAGVSTRLGEGRPCGNPVGTCTVAANGVGVLTGVYKYAYYEADPTGSGTTGLSPLSAPITLSANQTLVTVPLPRRGMGGRFLCRTKAGGSVYYFLKDLNGHSFYQTVWPDNTADAALTVLAPTVDTTVLYSLETNAGVKFLRTHPDQGTGAADLSLVTGDALGGTYSLDSYGCVYIRGGPTTRPLQTQMTGTADYQYAAYYLPVQNDGSGTASVGSLVWSMRATGETGITPPGNLGAYPALAVTTTMPSAAGTLVASAITATGAGSTAVSQTALSAVLGAGYTGTGLTAALAALNVTAGSATSAGLASTVSGVAAINVGVQSLVYGGTQNCAVWGGIGAGLVPTALSGVFIANAGTSGKYLFLGIINGALTVSFDASGNLLLPSGQFALKYGAQGYIGTQADGKFNLLTTAATVGVGFDVSTTAVLKVRNIAQSAYAQVDALGYSVGGVAGASKGAGAVTSITVVNGIVTAIS